MVESNDNKLHGEHYVLANKILVERMGIDVKDKFYYKPLLFQVACHIEGKMCGDLPHEFFEPLLEKMFLGIEGKHFEAEKMGVEIEKLEKARKRKHLNPVS